MALLDYYPKYEDTIFKHLLEYCITLNLRGHILA